jgi:transcriptional regulator with XRE-family HTH domain
MSRRLLRPGCRAVDENLPWTAMTQLTVLARTLKKTRQDRGWTLADVADRSGISATTLSKVERGKLSLTYEKIVDLSRGLGVEVGRLFHDGGADAERPVHLRKSVTRAGEGVRFDTGMIGYNYLHTELLNKAFYPLTYEIRARSLNEFGPMTAHDGAQLAYVLEGELEIHTEGYEPVRLYPGDSFYIDSKMPHAAISVGDGPCKMLGVMSALDQERADIIQETKLRERERRPRAVGQPAAAAVAETKRLPTRKRR